MSQKPRPNAEGIERAYQEPKGSMLGTTGFLTEFNGGWVFFYWFRELCKRASEAANRDGVCSREGYLVWLQVNGKWHCASQCIFILTRTFRYSNHLVKQRARILPYHIAEVYLFMLDSAKSCKRISNLAFKIYHFMIILIILLLPTDNDIRNGVSQAWQTTLCLIYNKNVMLSADLFVVCCFYNTAVYYIRTYLI